MKTKTLGLIIALLLLVQHAEAQIIFENGTLSEALVKAKKLKKPIFADVHAVWCGPCKRMAATAFQNETVSKFYNSNFINVKIDGEKGEGPALMSKYGLTAYPSLLYFNPDGSLFRKQVGAMDSAGLMKLGNKVKNPQSSPVLAARKKYYASAKTPVDIKEYLKTMADDEDDSVGYFGRLYYDSNKELNMSDELDFFAFYQNEQDPGSKNSLFFLDNLQLYGPEVYSNKISTWIQNAYATAVSKKDFSIVESEVKKLLPYLRRANPQVPEEKAYLEYVKAEFDKVSR